MGRFVGSGVVSLAAIAVLVSASSGLVLAGPSRSPFAAFNFLLNLDGIGLVAGFQETSGLGEAGPVTVTLDRGHIVDPALTKWFEGAAAGLKDARAGSIEFVDRTGKTTQCWRFVGALPTLWRGPSFHSQGAKHTVEEIQLAVLQIKRC